jgi:hypothetical protein
MVAVSLNLSDSGASVMDLIVTAGVGVGVGVGVGCGILPFSHVITSRSPGSNPSGKSMVIV